ncbi:MAG: ADP-ribosylglycohydrolase family protein [Alphaproteobacteria bacterium]|nr:ADP-ribosylglycohydrolase family protein [Alphaproteobacteria bacterium]
MQQPTATDRALGVFTGLAAGDRNGGPLQMALQLASSLAERRRFDPADVFHRYLTWYQREGFDTGPTAAQVFRLALRGIPGDQAVQQVHVRASGLTGGCNPAHRIGPMATAGFIPDDALPAAARSEAALTHLHPVAGEASVAVAVLCRRLIRGVDWAEALALTRGGLGREVAAALRPSRHATLDSGGYAPSVLRVAVWFLDQYPDFEEALNGALEFSGADNYAPVLVGALGGARWGAQAVPEDALTHLGAMRHQVADVAWRLVGGWR